MKKYVVVATIVGVSLYFMPHASLAQEAAKEPAAVEAVQQPDEELVAEETEFSYGTVKSISDNQMVVSEYDYDTDKDVDVTYNVPTEVTIEGAASLKEIAVGAAVDIDFLIKDGQKTATAITVEKPIEEDEDLALGLDEPAPAEGKT